MFCAQNRCEKAVIEDGSGHKPRLVRAVFGIFQNQGIRESRRERFLRQDMLAGAEGVQNGVFVTDVRGADVNDIEFVPFQQAVFAGYYKGESVFFGNFIGFLV